MVRGGVAGVELDGAAELVFGDLPVPVLGGADVGEGDVGFGAGVVEEYGEAGAGGRLGPDLDRGEDAVVAEELVGVGEGGVGASELGIFGDGLLEETDGRSRPSSVRCSI